MLYEYEGKLLLKKYGFPLAYGKVVENAQDAKNAADNFHAPVMVKAQILGGGRGKRGLIQLGKTPLEVQQIATSIFARNDLPEGPVRHLYIEQAVPIQQELYLSALIDRNQNQILVMFCAQGGIDIEDFNEKNPQAIAKQWIPFNVKPFPYYFYDLVCAQGFNGRKKILLATMLSKLVDFLREEDLLLAEINPFVFTTTDIPLVLDAKINLDPGAIYRHSEQQQMVSLSENLSMLEVYAQTNDLAFVPLEGDIGMISCGAGLSMATCDLLSDMGGKVANFLDVGGGASAEKVQSALELTFKLPHLKMVFINIFGGITRCDQVAEGIIAALTKFPKHVPIVVRLIGTHEKQGIEILANHGIKAFTALEPALEETIAQRKQLDGGIQP